MPLFDRTGPQGYGPRTGRGFGPCGDGFGRRGYGRGRGFRFWNRPLSKQEITEDIDQYEKYLKEELKDLEEERKRLEDEK